VHLKSSSFIVHNIYCLDDNIGGYRGSLGSGPP
jgi:hypothetical protein